VSTETERRVVYLVYCFVVSVFWFKTMMITGIHQKANKLRSWCSLHVVSRKNGTSILISLSLISAGFLGHD
jgi:hypothetical protein